MATGILPRASKIEARPRSEPASKRGRKRRAVDFELSHWVDETLPAQGVHVPRGVDEREFRGWLGGALGHYRSELALREKLPSPEAHRAWFKDFRDAIDGACKFLCPYAPPANVGAWLTLEAHKCGANIHTLTDQVADPLRVLAIVATRADDHVQRLAKERGNPGTRERDVLLSELVAKYRRSGEKDTVARRLAFETLRSCGVPTPRPTGDAASKDRTQRKAIARARSKR